MAVGALEGLLPGASLAQELALSIVLAQWEVNNGLLGLKVEPRPQFVDCDDIIPLKAVPVGVQFVLANPNYLIGKLHSRIKQVIQDLARPDLVEADAMLLTLLDIAAIKLASLQYHVDNQVELYRNRNVPVITPTQKDRLHNLYKHAFISAVNVGALEYLSVGLDEDGTKIEVLVQAFGIPPARIGPDSYNLTLPLVAPRCHISPSQIGTSGATSEYIV